MASILARLSDRPYPAASVRHVLGRGVDWVIDRLTVPPPGLRGPLGTRVRDAYPVVLLFQPGANEAAVRRTLEALPGLCSAAEIRVVLVVDRPHLAAARRSGVPVELLPDREAWERRRGEPSWQELVQHRLTIMRRDYAAAGTVQIPENGLGSVDVPELAAMLQADPLVRRHRARWRRSVSAVMRVIDRPVAH
jgi:hypothetical protein